MFFCLQWLLQMKCICTIALVLDQQRLYHMQAMADAATDVVAMTAAMAAATVAAMAMATMGMGECASLLLAVCLQISTSARLDLACLPSHPMLLQ